jgi:hypothetical protein
MVTTTTVAIAGTGVIGTTNAATEAAIPRTLPGLRAHGRIGDPMRPFFWVYSWPTLTR